MPDQQTPTPQEDDKSPNAAQAWTLINALLNDTITVEERARLEALATTDPAVARIYVRVIHLWSQLPLHLGSKQQIPTAWQTEASNELLSETLIMEALRLAPETGEALDDEIFKPSTLSPRNSPTAWQRLGRLPRWIGIAAILMLGVGLTWFLWPAGAPGVVTATAGVLTSGGITLSPGSKLPIDQEIELTQGAIELRIRQGAMVTIAAPARFSLPGNNAVKLLSGRLAANVPHDGIGFSVFAPGLKVVDLGTSFGVRTLEKAPGGEETQGGQGAQGGPGQGSEIAVFEGHVSASGIDSSNRGTSNPIAMSASSALVHRTTGDAIPRATTYAPDRYPRDISNIRIPLPLFDTGRDLDPQGKDAHWQVLQVALQPDWVPQAAELFHPSTSIGSAGATFISPHGITTPPPTGEYVFRTTVDIRGVETKNAKVIANIFATQAIVDVRINGSPALGASLLDDEGNKASPKSLLLPNQFWKQGVNTVDFVLNYLPENLPPESFAGLCVQWDASAPLTVSR